MEEGNTGAICAVCSEERRLSWQQHHRSLHITVGDYVKIRFRMNGGDDEWMWVEVTGNLGEAEKGCGSTIVYQGELRNDSIYNPDFQYGASLGFYRTDIADYCKGGDFELYVPWMPHGNILHEQHE